MSEISSQPSIHLVTGYLGSGKTQFLSCLLERPLLREHTAVIVNDFGAVMFDGIKLASGIGKNNAVEIVDVPGGCLCCSAIEDFQLALQQVIERGARRIFIEATGLADAEQVQRDLAFMRFPIDSTLCIVDALNIHRFQKLFHIVNAQIQAADVLLISKRDLVKNADSIGLLEDELHRLNPRAAIHVLNKGHADSTFLLQLFAPANRFVADVHPHLQEHLLHDGITAFRILLPAKVDFAALEKVLKHLPLGLIRVKGLLHIDDSPTPILLNYIAGAWNYQPLERAADVPNELFAIGQNILLQDLQSRFDALGAQIEGGTVRSIGFIDHEHHHDKNDHTL